MDRFATLTNAAFLSAAATVLCGVDARAEPVHPNVDPVLPALGSPGPRAPAFATPPSRLAYQLLAMDAAKRAGLPYALVDAVMSIESGYRPDTIGGVGEIGLMQVRPETAALLGFKGGSDALADPATNIRYGTIYLGQAWHLAGGNVCRALMKYRAGHGAETMSTLSSTYCARAKTHLASIGSPLADTITAGDLVAAIVEPATLAGPTSGPLSLKVKGRPKTGLSFWAAFKARIRLANAKVEAKWARRVAAR